MKFLGKVWYDHDLIQFWVNSEKPRDVAMLISLSAFVNTIQQSALLALLCCHLATENVMNFATSQHGGGVCYAFAPQLVGSCFVLCGNQNAGP